jgi:pimeloyl-ACP methyl ester carboxylesterase
VSRRVAAAVVVALTVAAVAGCVPRRGPDADAPSRVSLSATGCPEDVEAQIVARHDCLDLAVPAAGQASASVHLLVVRIGPPSAADDEPAVLLGTDYASRTDYGGVAPVAQRTGRVVYVVDQRGVGHSTPSLACPEVDALGGEVAGVVTADPLTQSRVASAAASCRRRLAADGIDPREFDAAAAAEDVSRLAHALGVRRWLVATYGSTSLVALAYARSHPDEVAGLVLDSPELVALGPDGEGGGLGPVLAAARRDCTADPSCRARYGDPARNWATAVRRARTAPLALVAGGRRIPIDEAGLVRVLRLVLGEPELGPAFVPAVLAELASGRPGAAVRPVAEILAGSPPYCAGIRPKCRRTQPIALGVLLTERCRLDGGTLPGATPWQPACQAWDATRDARPAAGPVTGIPALVFAGRYDPFADPATVRRELATVLPGAALVEDPAGGHNVLVADCLRGVRNAWTDALRSGGSPPAPTAACVEARRVEFR